MKKCLIRPLFSSVALYNVLTKPWKENWTEWHAKDQHQLSAVEIPWRGNKQEANSKIQWIKQTSSAAQSSISLRIRCFTLNAERLQQLFSDESSSSNRLEPPGLRILRSQAASCASVIVFAPRLEAILLVICYDLSKIVPMVWLLYLSTIYILSIYIYKLLSNLYFSLIASELINITFQLRMCGMCHLHSLSDSHERAARQQARPWTTFPSWVRSVPWRWLRALPADPRHRLHNVFELLPPGHRSRFKKYYVPAVFFITIDCDFC